MQQQKTIWKTKDVHEFINFPTLSESNTVEISDIKKEQIKTDCEIYIDESDKVYQFVLGLKH